MILCHVSDRCGVHITKNLSITNHPPVPCPRAPPTHKYYKIIIDYII